MASLGRTARRPPANRLLCEGDSLLAWVGPLGRRAILDRQPSVAPAALLLLDAAMGEIGAPACLLRGDVLVHANAAGEAAPAGDC